MGYPKDECETLDSLADKAHENARSKGFYDGFEDIHSTLNDVDARDTDRQLREHVLRHALSLLALVNTEVSEVVEAIRKPRKAKHIGNVPAYKDVPTGGGTKMVRKRVPFTQEEEEAADGMIRLFDYSSFRGLRIGAAVSAKMKYNATRPRLHGKKA